MDEFIPVAASVAILTAGLVGARFLQPRGPLISVSQPTKAVILGTALGGPFIVEQLNMLPVADAGGWELVTALALSVGLYLVAVWLVGIGDGTRSGTGSTGC